MTTPTNSDPAASDAAAEAGPREPRRLRLGTRATPLALAQSELVAAALRDLGHEVELVSMSSVGDRSLGGSLAQSKGVFTAELSAALRSGAVDLVVHSLKDLPTEEEKGLAVAAIPERECPHDVLLTRADLGSVSASRHFRPLTELLADPGPEPPVSDAEPVLRLLPPRARIGTSSPRRQAGSLELRPDLLCCAVRGSVGRRMEWLLDGAVDALLLAEAGLRRLPRDAHTEALFDQVAAARLSLSSWPCAPGQGALAIQVAAHGPLRGHPSLRRIHHRATADAVHRERSLLAALGGGCQRALGVWFDASGRSGHARLFDEDWREGAGIGDPVAAHRWHGVLDGEDHVRRALTDLQPNVRGPSGKPPIAPDEAVDSLDLVVTSSAASARRLTRGLDPAEAPAVAALDLFRTQTDPGAWPADQLDFEGPRRGWPWVLVSSPTAARVLVQRTRRESIWGRAPWCALGEGTARTLISLGIPANLVADARDGESLARYVLERIPEGNALFVPRSRGASRTLVERLREDGREVVAWAAYHSVQRDELAWPEGWPSPAPRVLFTAPSRVRAWRDLALPWPQRCWAIGEPTAETLREHLQLSAAAQLAVAETPTAEGVAELWRRDVGASAPA